MSDSERLVNCGACKRYLVATAASLEMFKDGTLAVHIFASGGDGAEVITTVDWKELKASVEAQCD